MSALTPRAIVAPEHFGDIDYEDLILNPGYVKQSLLWDVRLTSNRRSTFRYSSHHYEGE